MTGEGVRSTAEMMMMLKKKSTTQKKKGSATLIRVIRKRSLGDKQKDDFSPIVLLPSRGMQRHEE